ncbi:2-hydroxyacid dehydrogenase [Plantactinospora sp. KBS50]|uniref:2-hydroxyacid dehydrogenase n=1 Tax=Plantactinospora sp. KBS50 TaxID=2024580 RepID=UPI000BAAEDE6|nr:2-hydroxyacid dehydrogenase [Plantactinospora sp. KBS50]ASW57489.1 phosphoglycerate dehydrogenase [Plantactinospora sp. KBS50]
MKIWIPHEEGRSLLAGLPGDVRLEVVADPKRAPDDRDGVEFWVPPFLALGTAVRLAGELPDLRVVQLLSAGADAWTGRLPAGVTLCDARGVHDSSTAEWVLTAILAHLRAFDEFARAQGRHEWANPDFLPTDELAGKRVLIVGAGSIGAAIRSRLAPFEVEITMVARTARPAQGVHGVAELPNLLPLADVVVLIVPLTDRTRGLVDADFLAAMPAGALLVNAARGPVVDTAALVAELTAGRLRAALDVTDPEPLPAGHPLWDLPGLLLTPHVGGAVRGLLPRAYRLVEAQLRRYLAGEPLANQVVDGY